MDGGKRQLRQSLQLRLSFWLSVIILAVALVAGLFAFGTAFQEGREQQDDVLRQVAALIENQQLSVTSLAELPVDSDNEEAIETRIRVQPLGQAPAAGNGALLPIPNSVPDGLQTLALDHASYRVLVVTPASGTRFAVSQDVDARDEIAHASAFNLLLPFLILVPVLLLVVANLVRTMVRPLTALAAELDQREDDNLEPLTPTHVPDEVQPFVVAINRLFDRVKRSLTTERRFLADAAHELRTPLTALSLQAERLAQTDLSKMARERLDSLQQSISRSRGLIDQLLTLARSQNAMPLEKEVVSLRTLLQAALADLYLLAEARAVDIGLEGDGDAMVRASGLELATVVKNLLDNAIRYTPDNGRVDVRISAEQGRAFLTITDSGPGIAAAERERVFDPFYRVEGTTQIGSGLGLTIVKTLLQRMDGDISLSDGESGGLQVQFSLPVATMSSDSG